MSEREVMTWEDLGTGAHDLAEAIAETAGSPT